MSDDHPSGAGAALEALARARRRREAMGRPGFSELVLELLAGIDVEVLGEEWMQVTIVNRAKELAADVHLGELGAAAARAEIESFWRRKRAFFLDEDEPEGDGDDDGSQGPDAEDEDLLAGVDWPDDDEV